MCPCYFSQGCSPRVSEFPWPLQGVELLLIHDPGLKASRWLSGRISISVFSLLLLLEREVPDLQISVVTSPRHSLSKMKYSSSIQLLPALLAAATLVHAQSAPDFPVQVQTNLRVEFQSERTDVTAGALMQREGESTERQQAKVGLSYNSTELFCIA